MDFKDLDAFPEREPVDGSGIPSFAILRMKSMT
jgi:hypothetical protein